MLSTAVVSWLSRRNTGSASGGTNATSHWVWGEAAQRRYTPTVRYTALGYGIHHASSVFWALLFEHASRRHRTETRVAATAVGTAVLAYFVDYHVVPRRLTPGFERHLVPRDMVGVYAAFATGLWLGRLIRRQARAATGRTRRRPH